MSIRQWMALEEHMRVIWSNLWIQVPFDWKWWIYRVAVAPANHDAMVDDPMNCD